MSWAKSKLSNSQENLGTGGTTTFSQGAKMTLHGRTLVTAMCVAQVCNLLPHVVVPAIMAQHLMPLWHLSAAQAGLMASAYALGYMLAVPVLTTLTDRFDARGILMA